MKKNFGRLFVAFVATLAIMWIVPLPIYGVFSAVGALETPEVGSTARFFLSVSVIKIGFAMAFVATIQPCRGNPGWTVVAVCGYLVGDVRPPGGRASNRPGVVCIVCSRRHRPEAIYFPLSSLVVARIVSRLSESK